MVSEFRILTRMLLRLLGLVLFGGFAAFLLPLPGRQNPFAADIFFAMRNTLIPEGVQLIVTSPLGAFLAQTIIALFVGFVFALPYLLFCLVRYIAPGLYERERQAAFKFIIPSFLLFVFGCVFAYFFIIPPTFEILFSYAARLGIVPFFAATSFISSVFSIILITGILFLLPVAMVLLVRLGFVQPLFWKNHWRVALLIFLVGTAILTPDGSGVTMVILSLPMVVLYGVGIVASGT